MLLLCRSKVFNVEYFIYINCHLISLNATLHCCTKYNYRSQTGRAHVREHRGVIPPSLPPSLLPSSLPPQFSLDLHPAKTWLADGGIFSLTEKSYFWKMGKVLIHFPASWHVESQFWASTECMGRKMLMCWHRYLVTILGERELCGVLVLTNQAVI